MRWWDLRKDGGQSKEGWLGKKERKRDVPLGGGGGGCGAQRLKQFNEAVIYASLYNHKT